MKPVQLHGDDVRISGNMDTNGAIVMGIDLKNTKHLMSLLTNLYSDRILACIREYATNARDSHIDAGIANRPIEVSLPSPLSQYYKVRDYGNGLDLDGLREYYAKYGASSKRESDDFNGTLGIGCKAALTYSPSFSIVSIKDGKKYSVAVALNGDNIGELNVISVTSTQEPSGVEIAIPVKRSDMNDFMRKAQHFFRWWEPGTFRGLSSTRPTPISDLGDGLFTYNTSDVNQDLIVMGNVAYPIPFEGGLMPVEKRTFNIVYFAKMGEVAFAPSREALMTGALTQKAVDRIRGMVADSIAKSVQVAMDASPSKPKAIGLAAEFRRKYAGIDIPIKYKGVEVPAPGNVMFKATVTKTPREDALGNPVIDWQGNQVFYETTRSMHRVWAVQGNKERKVDSIFEGYTQGYDASNLNSHMDQICFVLNAPLDVNAGHRKIVRDYDEILRAAGTPRKSIYVFIPEAAVPGADWLHGIPVFDWNGIKQAVRDDQKARNQFSDSTKYDLYLPKGGYESRRIADNEKVLLTTSALARATDGHFYVSGFAQNWLTALGYDGMVVAGTNRWAKFLREHPNAVLAHDALATYIEGTYAKKNKAFMAKLYLFQNIDRHERASFTQYDVSKIADPELVELINDFTDKDVEDFNTKLQANILMYNKVFYNPFHRGNLNVLAAVRPRALKITEAAANDKAKRLIEVHKYYSARRPSTRSHVVEVFNALYYNNNRKV